MSNFNSRNFKTPGLEVENKNLTVTATSADELTGDNLIWTISTISAAGVVKVPDYDKTNYADFSDRPEVSKPIVVIKNAAAANVNNVEVQAKNGAGTYTTLFTFSADNSVTPSYVVLKPSIDATTGKYLWALA